ncbi:MAG: type VI secretion system baseplate subunit TssE [Acidobacteria bacterium]|nr:type VI secretion system baseplate subunit TssE [Acidobacteriota bacterium]MBV9475016.1 type VI secretion system baseplate subunit TssE [Acidobacteriota bacterium]
MAANEIHVRAPLFDRLVDGNAMDHETRPLRTLDRAGLKQSVRRELELLFNTRCALPVHHLPPSERTVADYGVPDLTLFSARDPADRASLADALRRAATAYEPRLRDVRVDVVPAGPSERAVSANFSALLVIEGVPESVSFEAVLSVRDGKVHVDAG